MNEILTKINQIGVVPVIAIADVTKAVPLAEALMAGGLPCAEITFRTAEGVESLRRITKALPDVLTGAGTVLTTAQVDSAIDAGAKFIVSPGFNPRVVSYCLDKDIPIVPGCVTPTDMEAAMEMGIFTVKFFPAEQAGGLPYLKALAPPYPRLRFMPTGGIGPTNLAAYLAFDRVVACGGSWMVTKTLLDGGDYATITRLAREAAEIVQQAS